MYITYFFYLYIQKCGRPRCFLSLFETIGGYVQVLYKYVHMCTGSFLYCKTLKVTEAINSFMNFFTQIQILIIKRSKAPKCCKIRQCHVTEHQSSQSFSKYRLISLNSTQKKTENIFIPRLLEQSSQSGQIFMFTYLSQQLHIFRTNLLLTQIIRN